MAKTFTITLSDGSVIENLELNGNNYISKKKLTAADFEGKLSHVDILDDETQETQVLTDAFLVQCVKFDKEYWFILAEKTQEEKDREELFAKTDRTMAAQEYNIMMGNLEDPSDEEE